MEFSQQDVYKLMFYGYPEILDVKQVSKALGVSAKTVYKLIQAGSLSAMRVGREFRVPKVAVMKYVKAFVFSNPTGAAE